MLDKDKEIFELKKQLHQKNKKQFPFNEIAEEIKALHDNVESVSYSNKITTDFSKTDTIPTFGIFWKNNVNSKVKTEENKNSLDSQSGEFPSAMTAAFAASSGKLLKK